MPKLVINNTKYNEIPLNEWYLEGEDYKGLIFIQHGHNSTKEEGADFLALPLARQGYFVVAIDAYKHGERIEEPYLTGSDTEIMQGSFGVVIQTAEDIKYLHENHYHNFESFDVIGTSMGAMIAYLLSTKTDKVNRLCSIIGNPDFLDQAMYGISSSGLDSELFFNEEVKDYFRGFSPFHNVEKMVYEQLFMLVGEKDKVVPITKTIEFYNKFYNDKMTLSTYDVGHEVSKEMKQDVIKFITT